MAHKIISIKELQIKSRNHRVQPSDYEGIYTVTSCTSGRAYRVDLQLKQCSCKRQVFIGRRNDYTNACSHVQAAFIFWALDNGYSLVARAADENVGHLHRKAVDNLKGDGVKFTARLDPNAKRKIEANLAHFLEKPEPVEEKPLSEYKTADEINDLLFGPA